MRNFDHLTPSEYARLLKAETVITSAKEDCVLFSSLFVCLFPTLRNNFRTDLQEIFREGWQWANEQMIKFRWLFGSPSGYKNCFPDSSLSGDTESG